MWYASLKKRIQLFIGNTIKKAQVEVADQIAIGSGQYRTQGGGASYVQNYRVQKHY